MHWRTNLENALCTAFKIPFYGHAFYLPNFSGTQRLRYSCMIIYIYINMYIYIHMYVKAMILTGK